MNSDVFQGIDTSRHLVYLVDDLPSNNTISEKMLAVTGLRTRSFTSAKEALKAARTEKPDVILLDILMPSMDGMAFLEALRDAPELSDIRVIIVSAVNEISEMMQSKALGACDYLTKPYTIDRLQEVVASQLKPQRNNDNTQRQ